MGRPTSYDRYLHVICGVPGVTFLQERHITTFITIGARGSPWDLALFSQARAGMLGISMTPPWNLEETHIPPPGPGSPWFSYYWLLMISKFTQQSQHQVTSTKTTLETPLTKIPGVQRSQLPNKNHAFYCCVFLFFSHSWELQTSLGWIPNLSKKTHAWYQKIGPNNRSKTQWLDKHRLLKAEPPGNRFEVPWKLENLGVKSVALGFGRI